MSLIACPECGRQVSDAASACPNCGHPVQQVVYYEPRILPKRSTSPLRLLVIALVLFGAAGVMMYLRQNNPDVLERNGSIIVALAHLLMWVFIIGGAVWVISRGVSRGIDESQRRR